jgi:DNA mismatch repair ATPase MutS
MQKRLELHSLYRFVAISEQIEALCVEYGIDLQSKSTDINDESRINLTRGLKHARYKHKDESIAVITPCVVAFSYEVYENIDSLASIFISIAEMDAYNAIANKMIEGSSTTNKFCFAQFIDQQKSAIHATEFWNVLVQDKAIVNNLCEDHNIILTGPNAGGKTTSIRAILQNIILTQSFGIAAASDFNLTQFDVIYSYLNISDDLINGLSLFASEVKRAQETLQKIKALESDEKFFFVLDELFTGTAGENGEACAYKFISRIAEFNNIQFIYATHFDKLKELGDKNDAFTNYKINAPIHNDMGKLVYPYTLSAGASNVNVAMQMAEEAGLFD